MASNDHDRSRSPRPIRQGRKDRSPQPNRGDGLRRRRSPSRERGCQGHSPKRHKRASDHSSKRDLPRSHHHKHDRAAVPAVSLPYSARSLTKGDYSAFEPVFAEYLDVQKQLRLEDMDEREAKGRWKSFMGKWNRGELAEGWYDPEMFARIASRNPVPSERLPQAELVEREQVTRQTDLHSDDDYGPALPNQDVSRRFGARAPTVQDLSIRSELDQEAREADRTALQSERKADRRQQKERLDELVPRAEPGTRERKLEKRQAVNDKMRQFRDKSPGMDAGNETELMGGGDSLDEYKKIKATEQRRKTEREIRREEIERAKREEIEERRRAWQEREEGTVAMLRELAKQRRVSSDRGFLRFSPDRMDNDEDYGTGVLMEDPEDYYPPSPPPTKQSYTMQSGKAVTLHLVGASPTEAHHLWNGAKIISDYLENDPSRVKGKTVLELGAAAGLPSLVAGILGARKVVMTDFPDPDLVSNMQKNIDECDETVEPRGHIAATIDALGFVWGADPEPLLARLPAAEDRFDVLILADLLFRHAEHGALVKTIKETLKRSRSAVACVFFTSYRPWKQDLDMKFFDVARDAGLEVEQVDERRLEKPLFENDPGDLDVQKTVRGFAVRWSAGDCR
ncbi:hypothetical protein S40288_06431 [Stachybotrys chartarum IBT 40288]|nr:hypothetical protein S40288_06431 [Stachybotrys chartarum IBT 40288]